MKNFQQFLNDEIIKILRSDKIQKELRKIINEEINKRNVDFKEIPEPLSLYRPNRC